MSGASLLTLLAVGSADQARITTYTVPRTSQPPALDGRLDDMCWKTACVVDSFGLLGGKKPSVKTTAFLTYDADALYVAYRCEEPLVDKLVVATKEHDGPTWKDDAAELFFNPSGDRRRYCQIAVNAAGVVMDNYGTLPTSELDKGYETGAVAKARVGRDEWTLELRIPFSGLPVEELDCPWTFHLARHRAVASELMTCLRSPVAGFHELKSFDVLEGIDLRRRRVAVAHMDLGELLAGTNVARATLRNASDAPAGVVLSAGIVGADPTCRVQRTVKLGPGKQEVVELPWDLKPEHATKTAMLSVALGDKVLQRRVVRIADVPPVFGPLPMRAYYCDPNEAARLDVPIRLAEGSRRDAQLRWTAVDAAGETVGRGLTQASGATAVVRLYWPRWREGRYTIRFELVRHGRPIAAHQEPILLVPSPWGGR